MKPIAIKLKFIFIILFSIFLSNFIYSNDSKLTFKNILKNQELPSTFIKDIEIDGNTIYIASAKGISRYNLLNNKWEKHWSEELNLEKPYILDIEIDEDYIWAASVSGLAKYDKKTGKWFTYTKKSHAILDNELTCLLKTENELWIGTKYFGLSVLDLKNNTFKNYTKYEGLSSNTVTSICEAANTIYIGTNKGLCAYSRFTKKLIRFDDVSKLTINNITSLAIGGSFIYIGTKDEGLAKFNIFEKNFSLEPIDDIEIVKIMLDGNFLWIIRTDGVLVYNTTDNSQRLLTKNEGLINTINNGIAIDGNYIYLGTDVYKGGLSIIDKHNPQVNINSTSGYIAINKIAINGTIFDYNNIKNYDIEYRLISKPDKWITKNIEYLQERNFNIQNKHIASIKLDLPKYYEDIIEIKLKVENKYGFKNTSSFIMPITTIEPKIIIDTIPKAYNKNTYPLTGTYVEKYLKYIRVYDRGKLIDVKINTENQTLSYDWRFYKTGSNNIEIEIANFALIVKRIPLSIIYIDKKPEIKIKKTRYKTNNPYISIPISINERYLDIFSIIEGNIQLFKMDELKKSVSDKTFKNPSDIAKEYDKNKKKNNEISFNFANPRIDSNGLSFDLYIINLKKGLNELTFHCRNLARFSTSQKIVIDYESLSPEIIISEKIFPFSNTKKYSVWGTVSSKYPLKTLYIMPIKKEITFDNTRKSFSTSLELKEGENNLIFKAEDIKGYVGEKKFKIIYNPNLKLLSDEIDDLKVDEGLAGNIRDLENRIQLLEKKIELMKKGNSYENRIEQIKKERGLLDKKRITSIKGSSKVIDSNIAGFLIVNKTEEMKNAKIIAKKYLGSERYYTEILRYNYKLKNNNIKHILIPTKSLYSIIYGSKNKTANLNISTIMLLTARVYHVYNGNISEHNLIQSIYSSSYCKNHNYKINNLTIYNKTISVTFGNSAFTSINTKHKYRININQNSITIDSF